MSTGKHRVSSASTPRTPFNTKGALFEATQAISRNMKAIKIGTIAVSTVLVAAMATGATPSLANTNGTTTLASAVSRSQTRTDLTTETATVAKVEGAEWSLSSDSSNINVQYSMTSEQTASRDKLVTAYETAKQAYGTYTSASKAVLDQLGAAMNTAADHLKDTTTSVDTYNADIDALNKAISSAKSSHAAATAAASRSAASSSSSAASAQTFSSAEATGTAADVINYANSFVGKVPYVWGGTTPSGWDCSGFVQYVFGHYGISLPRVSGAQATVGTAVSSLAEAKPGDIIANSMHAGIYIGNGKVVNALNPSQGTQITPVAWAFSGSYSIRRVF
ncbi:C40 family peptidase [Alloscardovia venturai]|uniref:C40 family peptidase n=1 Tax=Alloscardovia venturai TaxID=1769421 RepID=A0ABW2Y918_9BIFI